MVVSWRKLRSFTGTIPSHWFRDIDYTWVKIQTKELEAFSARLNHKDDYFQFTREDVKEDSLAFLDCTVKIERNRNFSAEVYRKPTQISTSYSHHPLNTSY